MKLARVSVLLFVGSLLGLTNPSFSPSQPGPRINFQIDSYDFGRVPVGTIVSPEFPFTNTGDTTLIIQKVRVEALEGC